MKEFTKIAVLGGGSWGLAFAVHLHRCGLHAGIWEFNPEDAKLIYEKREHPDKLPGISIPREIEVSDDIARIAADAELIVLAIPSHAVREVSRQLPPILDKQQIILNLAKGLEVETLTRMSEVILAELGDEYEKTVMTLSGPSHAEEVSKQIPTTVTIAGNDEENLKSVQEAITSDYFRVYTNTDLVGVELAGSLKNIIAIAAGICDGLEFGDNTKGALLTRGLTEITRLGLAMGASQDTFAGLSGLGDLITTCLSRHSRNRYVGEQIGRGKTLSKVLSQMKMVAEGVNTTNAAYRLSRKYGVEMPITDQMYAILFEEKAPLKAVNDLMSRDPKPEKIDE
ncbi:MAG: NAD(P)H-dependent glycerol-3-phosphate dehydrogenase [candidate division Zixibacteria bacterium]|nr:NAD(P)H-dependent glycerol-3-phosphate dehydrogenase [candidate division Zixibacteria bacterium]